ncbi:manganese efflux pump MntP family protein [Desulfovibrio inopinatus]|uniref:manganese efflux pump MntP n=1 Tax=Desulfovibrio inopinatus TaxID=102109 RepID=UPI0003FE3BB8|nr:manganese efflux pump MntP family protein [Desulfovibrio inopinatus]
MSLLELLAIAVALAMDAFAVALATGVRLRVVTSRQSFRLSWHFGLFQAMMPVVGWYLGLTVRHFVDRYAHFIAFGLLAAIGLKMLHEALGDDENDERKDPTRGVSLVALSVATSIDALAVGLSLSLLNVPVFFPAFVIGLTAFLLTAVGLRLGTTLGNVTSLGGRCEVLGAVVLLGLAVKVLVDHGVFS